MRHTWLTGALLASLSAFGPATAEEAPKLSALARMPVREVTIFKDGHAFVLHQGAMPVDEAGDVRMDYLPNPVLGTFWSYSTDKRVRLSGVTASMRRVLVERSSTTVRELLEGNPGASISFFDTVLMKPVTASVLEVPTRSAQEQEQTGLPNSGERLPEKSNIILVKRDEGVQALGIDRIQDVTFRGPFKKTVRTEEFRNLLTLHLEWPGGKPAKTADVGMMYVQKGIRWIPSYKVNLDNKGTATVVLQATLVNELTDLTDVTANLVVGVPSFFFQDTPDPIGMQQTFAQLSQYFQNNAASGQQSGFAMSNSMMIGQSARFSEGAPGPAGPPGFDRPGGGNDGVATDKAEDLFVFTTHHITLKRGQRMIVPLAEATLPYRDVFTLDLPFSPPKEVRSQIRSDQQAEIARLLSRPKVMHNIRVTNRSKYPLTTAPALVVSGDRVIAQSLMTYTPVGGDVDISLTAAVDVTIKKTEVESSRVMKAAEWEGIALGRVEITGNIALTSYRDRDCEIEVTRRIIGNVGKADHGGKPEMLGVADDDEEGRSWTVPNWWGYYNWPGWWSHFNGAGKITWKQTLPAGKSLQLGYTWSYFWR